MPAQEAVRPQRSTLRTCALYCARAMISQKQYREFRRAYLAALANGKELPELPSEWHDIPPGTLSEPEPEEEPPKPPLMSAGVKRRMLIALLAAAALGGILASTFG